MNTEEQLKREKLHNQAVRLASKLHNRWLCTEPESPEAERLCFLSEIAERREDRRYLAKTGLHLRPKSPEETRKLHLQAVHLIGILHNCWLRAKPGSPESERLKYLANKADLREERRYQARLA